jgi:hypothetical protein
MIYTNQKKNINNLKYILMYFSAVIIRKKYKINKLKVNIIL